jgi:type II secretory pathway pseudopilin PulG
VAILGSALVAIVLASAKLTVQSRRAQDRIVACEIAEIQLRSWWRNPDTLQRNASGPVPGREGWTWTTRTTVNPQADDMKGQTVVLEIRSPAARGSEPSAAVEIILPERNDDDTQGNDAD